MSSIAGVLFPVFGIILCGYLAGRFNVLGPTSAEALNRFVYYFALPPLLFTLTAEARLADIANWPFIFAYLAGSLATLVIALAGGRLLFGHRRVALGFHGLSAIFPNTAYMGIPIFVAAFGEQAALPAIVATVAGNTLFIGGAVAVAEFDRASKSSPWGPLGALAAVFARNPLLIASLLAILFSVTGAALPKPAAAVLHLMGAAAVPAALFAIGLSLVDLPAGSGIGEIGWLTGLKLFVHPALTWILAVTVFMPEPVWAKSAVLLAGMPVGTLAFVVARQYGTYVERASAAIVVSTLVSPLTLAALMSLLNMR